MTMMQEKALNKRNVFIEEYREKFILVDYSEKPSLYAGISLLWNSNKSDIVKLFISKEEALKIVTTKPYFIVRNGWSGNWSAGPVRILKLEDMIGEIKNG